MAFSFSSKVKYGAFEWTSCNPDTRARGRRLIAEARVAKGKTAVNWAEVTWTDNGVLVPWKEPVEYKAGYRWFWGKLSSLVHVT